MAKYKKAKVTPQSHVGLLLLAALVVGLAGGFFAARSRYMDKITEISIMNMEKAVTIDSLNQQIQVLGASDHAE